ncbi:MAG TPA: ribosome biogenesis GTPase Der [Chloroflexota bacterium]|nr:ribosome biogenesis GTPase Der [Chloroflexota bacterium]
MPKPIIALVGRPNVGKSTLFNRIVGERIAIVEDVAGTTRDRLYYDADWNGRTFTLVDTGGLEIEPGSDIAQRVREQAELAVDEADLILFMVDAQLGITGGDLEVASLLRQTQKPVLVVANKADTARGRFDSVEFYRLGLKDVYPISALHGTGTGELLDAIVTRMPAFPEEEAPAEEGVRVAFVGRPNVGKSSLLNAIVGRERAVVTEIPGTTRDTIDVGIEVDGRKMVLVDTAGVRRRGRIEVGVERYSVIRSIRAIERADVVAVIIDASEGVTAQDTHLAGFARDEAKGILLAVNKWDLVPQTNVTQEEWTLKVREEFKFVPFAPLLFLSARQHWHVTDVVNTVFRISEERHKRVPTAGLNDIVEEAVHAHSPGAPHGRQLKIFYATQVTVNPPTFVFFVNDSSLLQFSYQRYLENRLRQAFGFEGTAVRMFFRNRVATQTEKR